MNTSLVAASSKAQPEGVDSLDHRKRKKVSDHLSWMKNGALDALPVCHYKGYVQANRDGHFEPQKMRAFTKEFFDSTFGRDFMRHSEDLVRLIQKGPARTHLRQFSLATIWAEAEKNFEKEKAYFGETSACIVSYHTNTAQTAKQVVKGAKEIHLLFFEAMLFLQKLYEKFTDKELPELQNKLALEATGDLQKEHDEVLVNLQKNLGRKTKIELRQFQTDLQNRQNEKGAKVDTEKLDAEIAKLKEQALKLKGEIDQKSEEAVKPLKEHSECLLKQKRKLRLHVKTLFQTLAQVTLRQEKVFERVDWRQVFDTKDSFTFSDVTVVTVKKKQSVETVVLFDRKGSPMLYDPRGGMSTFANTKAQKTDFRSLLEEEASDFDSLQKMRFQTYLHDKEAAFSDVMEAWGYNLEAMPKSLVDELQILGIEILSYSLKSALERKAFVQFTILVPNLKSLTISGVKLSNHDLDPLQALRALSAIALENCAIDESTLEDLAKMKNLERLSIDSVDKMKPLFDELSQLKYLETIHFSERKDGDKPNQTLKKFLEFVKGGGRKLLAECKALKEIKFTHFNLFSDDVTELQKLFKSKLPRIKLSQHNVV